MNRKGYEKMMYGYQMWSYAHFLRTAHPELPSNVIVVSQGQSGTEPELLIQRTGDEELRIDDTFRMTISDAPSVVNGKESCLTENDIGYFHDFIIRNKKVLVGYWNGKVDAEVLAAKLVF